MTVSNTHTLTNLPGTVDIQLYAGDTYLQPVYIRENGSLVTLTGSSFAMRILDNRGTVLLNLSSPASGITIVGAGHIQIELTAAQTDALPVNCPLPYDIQWTNSGGVKKTLITGKIYSKSDITP
jgi:hypothetical protein